jgi:hypothetical protein
MLSLNMVFLTVALSHVKNVDQHDSMLNKYDPRKMMDRKRLEKLGLDAGFPDNAITIHD